MAASANVAHTKGDTIDLMLILSPDTNCTTRSLLLAKLPSANLLRSGTSLVLDQSYAIYLLKGEKLFLLTPDCS